MTTSGLVPSFLIAALIAGAPQPPFRSGVNLVLVDMRVVADGKQIADLRSEEIALLVDGVPRPITSLDYYAAHGVPRDPSSSGSTVGGQSSQNRIGDGSRRVVFVVDRDSIESGEARQLEKTARTFIERLPPSYAIAVVPLPLGRGIRFEPNRRDAQRALKEAFAGTTRRGLGLEGLAGFGCDGATASSGCGDQGLPRGIAAAEARRMNAGAELQIRGRAVLGDLLWLFRALADGPSDVVIVSGGLPQEERLRPEIDKVTAAARAANVHVHSIRIADLARVRVSQEDVTRDARIVDIPQSRASSYGLPAETGGLEEDGSLSGEGFFNRLTRELSGAYLLAFEPLPSERDGKPHRIEIRLPQRRHAAIHARKVFVLPVPRQTEATREPPVPAPAAAVPLATPPLVETLTAPSDSGADAKAHLRTLIERASTYVEDVQRALPNVVAEERYVQVVKTWTGAPAAASDDPELAWRDAGKRWNGKKNALRRRQLLSDVLMVQAPGRKWVGYRDVAEVDGKSVRDRADRVQKLFMSGDLDDRRSLQRIAEESARLNLGTDRNVNTPTFPLQIVLAANVGRFLWTMSAPSAPPGGCCTVVGFREVASPTIVKTRTGDHIRMSGELWIEPGTGRVWRASVRFVQAQREVGGLDVTFRRAPDLEVLVPDRLLEWALTMFAERQAYVQGLASYSNLRRFTVTADEDLK